MGEPARIGSGVTDGENSLYGHSTAKCEILLRNYASCLSNQVWQEADAQRRSISGNSL